jgi:hypothetical protein
MRKKRNKKEKDEPPSAKRGATSPLQGNTRLVCSKMKWILSLLYT